MDHKLEIWQINLKKFREDLGVDMTTLASLSGVSIATIKRFEDESGKGFRLETLEKIAKALGHPLYTLFVEDHERDRLPTAKSSVLGEIWPEELRLIAEWVMLQENPIKMAGNIRFMVETRYPEFEKWLKKRDKKCASDTI